MDHDGNYGWSGYRSGLDEWVYNYGAGAIPSVNTGNYSRGNNDYHDTRCHRIMDGDDLRAQPD